MQATTPLENDYSFNPDAGIWLKKDAPPFHYSDGDQVENRIGELLGAARDKSVASDELKAMQTDWPSVYYLSPNRATLLRPLADTRLTGARVLELGCGMGAVTRYLGETAAEVIAVEGSRRRGSIAALRCQGLANTHVLIDDIMALPPSLGEFDIVTLIGVLEYARRYGVPGAELELLRKARSFIRPGGILILAIENKLGLKYLGGVPEDHLGRSWVGPTNGYRPNGVATWSRREITGLLAKAGFSHHAQFLALPDYKLPKTIVTPEGLAATPEELNLGALFGNNRRLFEPMPLFNIQEGWESAASAGLVTDLADSLCFIASPDAAALTAFPDGLLVRHYGDLGSLPHKYAKEVSVRRENGRIMAKRVKISQEPARQTGDFRQIIADEPYYPGELLISQISKVAMRPDWTLEEFFQAFDPWVKALLARTDASWHCDSGMLDYMPFNLVWHNGELVAFDQEWGAQQPIPLLHLLYRGFFNTVQRIMPLQRSSRHNMKSGAEMFRAFLRYLNLPASLPQSLDYLWWQELKFLRFVKQNPNFLTRKDFPLIYMN